MEDEKGRIVYQNKDVASKVFAGQFKGNFFKTFGLKLPEVVSVEPTNLPEIEANELRMDNLFLLSDGSYAIFDYESVYREENKIKYLNYVARLTKRLYNESKQMPKIRIVIVYTADVDEGSTNPVLDLGDDRLTITEAFLTGIDADATTKDAKEKISKAIELTEEEMLRLMICPLAVKGEAARNKAIEAVIDLIGSIKDEEKQRLLLRGLLVFTDKVITKENSEEIRSRLMLTKVEQIIEEEKKQAVKEAEERVREDTKKEDSVLVRFEDGMSIEKIAEKVNNTVEYVRTILLKNGLINA